MSRVGILSAVGAVALTGALSQAAVANAATFQGRWSVSAVLDGVTNTASHTTNSTGEVSSCVRVTSLEGVGGVWSFGLNGASRQPVAGAVPAQRRPPGLQRAVPGRGVSPEQPAQPAHVSLDHLPGRGRRLSSPQWQARPRPRGGEVRALTSVQPQRVSQPGHGARPRPGRPALLNVSQRALADARPAGQLILRDARRPPVCSHRGTEASRLPRAASFRIGSRVVTGSRSDDLDAVSQPPGLSARLASRH